MEKRFKVLLFEDLTNGSGPATTYVRILVDKKTGVNYLCYTDGMGTGLTPLLNSEGKVIVTK